MSKMRPKPRWWSYKTYTGWGAVERRINRGGHRAVEKRIAQREIKEQS